MSTISESLIALLSPDENKLFLSNGNKRIYYTKATGEFTIMKQVSNMRFVGEESTTDGDYAFNQLIKK